MSQKLVLFWYENSYIEEVTLRRRSAYVTGEDFSVKKKWKWIKRKSVSLVVVVLLFCCTVLSVMRLIPLDCCYCGSSPSTLYLSLATIFLSFSSSSCRTVGYFTLTDKNYFYPLLFYYLRYFIYIIAYIYLWGSPKIYFYMYTRFYF